MPFPLAAALIGGGVGLLKGLFGHHEEGKQHDAAYGAYMNSFNRKAENENSRRAILGALASSMGVGKFLPQSGAGSIDNFMHGFHPTALTEDQYTGPQKSLFGSAVGGALGGASEAYAGAQQLYPGGGTSAADLAPKAGGGGDPFAGEGPQLPGVGEAAHGLFGGGGGGGAAAPAAPQSPFGQIGGSNLSSLLKLPLPK